MIISYLSKKEISRKVITYLTTVLQKVIFETIGKIYCLVKTILLTNITDCSRLGLNEEETNGCIFLKISTAIEEGDKSWLKRNLK